MQQSDFSGFHFESSDAEHVAVGIAHQVERHPLDEELRIGHHVALI
jgi:hypothetical protein